ncbi:RNA polymerase-associated protein RTF1 homolog [Drosophila rhopaloa]|uniref:RNA polymerase-associated protein RTF1 homolog n=1 Tax=Drosophila rhopaloa TaxID=1041015 RepID=A0A6P4ESQ4_DRORH|nr:RNA polymerase-associated protein RTF1 homolog [Drosophila rhopaloa]
MSMSGRQTRRPAAEIVRELRRLRSSPLRIDDEDERWAEGHEGAPAPDVPVASRRELEQLRLSRHRIGLLLVRPAFEQAVTGCFVRVNINGREELPDYRIAEILGLGELDIGYKVEDIPTNVALKLRYEDLVMHHEINDISNLAFTHGEFELWRDNCVNQAISPPTTHRVTRKKIELYNALQCEAKVLATTQKSLPFELRQPQKRGIMERHGGVYPWPLKHPLPLIPPPPPLPPPTNPPRGLTYRPEIADPKPSDPRGEEWHSGAGALASPNSHLNDK